MKTKLTFYLGIVIFIFTYSSISNAEIARGFVSSYVKTIAYEYSPSKRRYVRRSVLNQQDDREISTSCGAMSFLILENYFASQKRSWKSFYIPSRRGLRRQSSVRYSKKSIKRSLRNIYAYVNKTLNAGNYINTRNEDLKKYANGVKGWKRSYQAVGNKSYQYDSKEQLYNQYIRKKLKENRPSIVLLKRNSRLMPELDYEHYIVIFKADNRRIGYADPWHGKIKYANKRTFFNSWVDTGITVNFNPPMR